MAYTVIPKLLFLFKRSILRHLGFLAFTCTSTRLMTPLFNSTSRKFEKKNNIIAILLLSFCLSSESGTNTWSCGCSGQVYNVAKIIVSHSVATWGTSQASAANALNDCRNGDASATLINSTNFDMPCFIAYRAQLLLEFTMVPSTADIWLANRNGQCVRFSGTTNTVVSAPCDSNDRELYLCTRPINTSKYTKNY